MIFWFKFHSFLSILNLLFGFFMSFLMNSFKNMFKIALKHYYLINPICFHVVNVCPYVVLNHLRHHRKEILIMRIESMRICLLFTSILAAIRYGRLSWMEAYASIISPFYLCASISVKLFEISICVDFLFKKKYAGAIQSI